MVNFSTITLREKEKFISTPIEMNPDNICQQTHASIGDTNIISQNRNKSISSGKNRNKNIGVNIFEQVKECVSIADAVELYHMPPNSRGYVLCPFHSEKTPSFRVYENTNSYYCFGCGASGSTIDFVMKLFGLDSISAVRKLDADFRLHLPVGDAGYSVQENIKHRKAAKVLVDDFNAWEKKAFMILKKSYHALKNATANAVANHHSQALQAHIDKLAELPYIEYLLDMMIENTGDFTAQVMFYKDYGKAVAAIEQREADA